MVEIKEPNVRPNSKILTVLEGEVSEPKDAISQKPETKNQLVKVRIVEKGSGMVGLKDREDNKEWAGIFNHILTTARFATFLAEKLREKGIQIDPNLVLNAVLVSHAGRRQWDEAVWYKDIVKDASDKAKLGNQPLSTQLLKENKIDQSIVEVVDAHAMPALFPIENIKTWEQKVALYADNRTTQHIVHLEDRLIDLHRLTKDGRWTQQQYEDASNWTRNTQQEIFGILTDLKPQDFNDNFPPMPRWEKYIRRLYINDAENQIFSRLSVLYNDIIEGKKSSVEELNKEFPQNTWWGNYARELYQKRDGNPLNPKMHKHEGIARAITFYSQLEQQTNK